MPIVVNTHFYYYNTIENGGANMKFRYITIEREYGSGGTKIAQRLSEVSGVPCYGKEILQPV